ncbi:hypothetical protein, partial [Amycolatopsis lurida]|uniref:hypothetical protein n=1 Tax=Amycolatopsis lurida TaxID=31959 RepID=UPI003653D585
MAEGLGVRVLAGSKLDSVLKCDLNCDLPNCGRRCRGLILEGHDLLEFRTDKSGVALEVRDNCEVGGSVHAVP